MSKGFKFELNKKGVIELFKSPEVQAWLQDCGDYVADIAEGMAQEEGAASLLSGYTFTIAVLSARCALALYSAPSSCAMPSAMSAT